MTCTRSKHIPSLRQYLIFASKLYANGSIVCWETSDETDRESMWHLEIYIGGQSYIAQYTCIVHCDTLKSILDADHDKVDMLVHCAQLATGSPFENYFANSCKSRIEGANIYSFCIPERNLQYIALRNCAIGLLSWNYLESRSYRSSISQLKSLVTLGWMCDPSTIGLNDYNENKMRMMKEFELVEIPRQLHCLLNLDNLSPADGKINWKWISKAEIEIQGIQTGVKWKYAWGSCPQILSSLSRKISIGRSSCTEC